MREHVDLLNEITSTPTGVILSRRQPATLERKTTEKSLKRVTFKPVETAANTTNNLLPPSFRLNFAP